MSTLDEKIDLDVALLLRLLWVCGCAGINRCSQALPWTDTHPRQTNLETERAFSAVASAFIHHPPYVPHLCLINLAKGSIKSWITSKGIGDRFLEFHNRQIDLEWMHFSVQQDPAPMVIHQKLI